jgi:uncharacterized membrane-anchored protein
MTRSFSYGHCSGGAQEGRLSQRVDAGHERPGGNAQILYRRTIMKRGSLFGIRMALLLMLLAPCFGNAAQGRNESESAAPGAAARADEAVQTEEDILAGLKPHQGPGVVSLGSQGEVKIPDGFLFFNAKDTRTLLDRMENLTSGDELGLVTPHDLSWIAVFAFDSSGYVEDTGESADIDADELLQSFREGAKEANKEKAARGWAPSEVVGWGIPPHYNTASKNLEWSLRFRSEGKEYDNYSVRILGRDGVMKVIFAGDAESYAQSLQQARNIIADYSFVSGKTHAEWKQGDKIAGYGLAALIAGGTAAAVAKSGLLGKFFKPIALAVAAALAALLKIFRRKKKGDAKFEAPESSLAAQKDDQGQN